MDLYVILGLERGATPADVKRAYKRLAREYHPDINPGDHSAAERGTDLHQSFTVSFRSAMRGAALPITVTRHEHCRTCKGLGRLNVAETRCPHCHGSGIGKSARGHMVFSKPCAVCSGSG